MVKPVAPMVIQIPAFIQLLPGGKERLPSIAFNTFDGKTFTYPEEASLDR